MTSPLAGRYSVVRQLGSGKHSIVFEATDLKLNRPVAIKVVAPSSVSVPNVAQRLELEGRIAATLSHPNIYAVTDIDRLDSGLPFLVLELLVGEPLSTRIERQGALPVGEAVEIAEQMLAGLGAAHARGVIHRDVKPSNVFLTHAGVDRTVAKVIDFGIAQMKGWFGFEATPLTEVGYVVGTPEYMAPEQVRGWRDFDARTDVYAAGVVLYEMLTGDRPFRDRPAAAMLEAIAFEAIPSITLAAPQVPPPVARAVDLALAKDRERRHRDASAFLRALRSTAEPAQTGVTQILTKKPPEEWDLQTLRTRPPEGALSDSQPGSDSGSIDRQRR